MVNRFRFLFVSLLSIFVLFLFVCTVDAKEAKYVRWSKSHKPLKVYIDNGAGVSGMKATYPADVTRALAKWKSDTKGLTDFIIIKDKSQADIVVNWADKMRKEDIINQASGHSYVWGITKLGYPTKITLVTRHPLHDKDSLSDSNIYMIALHEIGHALGIWWHTRDPKDIMYPDFLINSTTSNGAKLFSNQNKGVLSSRDIQNLIALYNNNNVVVIDKLRRGSSLEMPSFNNSVVGAIETTGSAAATVSSKSTQLDLNLGEALNYLKKNPNSFEAYNNIGLIYLQNGDFSSAVKSFNKALTLNATYSKAHFNLGLTYSQMKQYPDAINQYKRYLELNPEADNSSDIKKEIERLENLSMSN